MLPKLKSILGISVLTVMIAQTSGTAFAGGALIGDPIDKCGEIHDIEVDLASAQLHKNSDSIEKLSSELERLQRECGGGPF